MPNRLSMEEINKRRVKLGLPPMQSTTSPEASLIPTTKSEVKPIKKEVTKPNVIIQEGPDDFEIIINEKTGSRRKKFNDGRIESMSNVKFDKDGNEIGKLRTEMSSLEKTTADETLKTSRLGEDVVTFKDKVALKREEMKLAKEKQKDQAEGATGGLVAAFAESRLGSTSSAAKAAEKVGLKNIDRSTQGFLNTLQQNEIAIQEAEVAIERAITDRDTASIDNITAEIEKLRAENLEIQQEVKDFEDEKQTKLFDKIDTLGPEVFATMPPGRVGTMFEEAGLTFAEGIAYNASAARAVNNEDLVAQAEFKKLQQDIVNGASKDKVTSQKEFEYYQSLKNKGLTEEAAEYALLTGISDDPDDKNFGFRFEDDKWYVTDPKTGAVSLAHIGDSISSPSFRQVGNPDIGYDYGSQSGNVNDNMSLQSLDENGNNIIGTPGVDIDGPTGTPLMTFAGGTVTSIANVAGYGNQVIITDDIGNQHMYSHMRELPAFIKVGQDIVPGASIGFMGNTGSVFGVDGKPPAAGDAETGSHLDYRVKTPEAINGSYWANPHQWDTAAETQAAGAVQQLVDRYNLAETPSSKDKITQEASRKGIFDEFNEALVDDIPIDPTSQSILSQTGLSMPSFMFLTKGTPALARMSSSARQKYMKEAEDFANSNNIDVSVFQSLYGAYSKTIEANALRNNQAAVAEMEVAATLDNVEETLDDTSFNKLTRENLIKMWAGKEINDPTIAKYKFHLNQLREEFALYNAALAGQLNESGQIREINDSDHKRAEDVIFDGINQDSISGFRNALESSMEKMTVVLDRSITNQQALVWDLFGVEKPDGTVDPFSDEGVQEAMSPEAISSYYENLPE